MGTGMVHKIMRECITILRESSTVGKSAQFELPGKFMKVSYNDSLSD